MVLAFVIAYLSGDEENTIHIYAGYYILGLLGIRILWGFIGTRPARFSSFKLSPSAVVDYLKGFVGKGSGTHYLGHNPAGGWMVIALLISLLLTGFSGLKVYGAEGKGPLAQSATTAYSAPGLVFISDATADRHDHKYEVHDGDEQEYDTDNDTDNETGEEFWEEIHELSANFTLLLVFLHIAGVFASSLKQRQNLVQAMITGYKQKNNHR